MDVIGSFMTLDVFVAATLSLLSKNGKVLKREVVTDSPGRIDFSSWRLTPHGHLSDD